MALDNLPKREEYLRKKRNRKIAKYGIIVFLVVLIIGLVIYISHRPAIRISKVELSGGILVTESEIETKSLSFLEGSYIWLFPRDSAFLYPKKSLRNYLKETFKRIDTISIHRKDFHTLSIDITERKPFAIWCKGLPGSNTKAEDGSPKSEECYFIDQNSTIFAPAPQFSGDAYFKYYGRVSSDSPIGNYYISSTTGFMAIADFVERVKKLSIGPLYIIAKDNDQFSMVLSGGGEIYFDTKESLPIVAENLEALLRTPELHPNAQGILPVDYIDLRYGNKLFYKLR